MLTSKQKELLIFIHERVKDTGVPPSFDEMKEALSLQSKSGVHRLIIALEERGFIRRLPHRARAIEVIKLPDAMTDAGVQRRTGFSPNVIEGSMRRAPQLASPPPGYADVEAVVPGGDGVGSPEVGIIRGLGGRPGVDRRSVCSGRARFRWVWFWPGHVPW